MPKLLRSALYHWRLYRLYRVCMPPLDAAREALKPPAF